MNIWDCAIFDKVRNSLVQTLVDVLESSVNPVITRRKSVTEVKLEDNVVVFGVEVKKVLWSLLEMAMFNLLV